MGHEALPGHTCNLPSFPPSVPPSPAPRPIEKKTHTQVAAFVSAGFDAVLGD